MCGAKLRPPLPARSAGLRQALERAALVVGAHHGLGQRLRHGEHVGRRGHPGQRAARIGRDAGHGDGIHGHRHAHMPFAVEVGDGKQVQRLAQLRQPGGDLGRLRQHVAAGQLQVLLGIAAQRGRGGHRRDQLAVAGAHALRDLLPGGAARQVDGHDVGAPLRQPGQRPGLAAGAQQHQVAVRQVEPFRMGARQVQRLRVGRLDHAGGGPGVDAPRQRVAAAGAGPCRAPPSAPARCPACRAGAACCSGAPAGVAMASRSASGWPSRR